jgi:DNA-binding NarL/FixJ family response regulator
MYRRLVSIIEDDAFMRSLLASHLEAAGFIVSVASNFVDGLRLIESVDPDAVVLDIDLGPGPNGFDIAYRLRRKYPDISILFLTTLSDPRFSNSDEGEVLKNEAFLNKNMVADASEVVGALEAALMNRGVKSFRHDLDEDRPLGHLSRVQIQVLRLVAEGKTNQQIAEIRGRSLASTESVIARTMQALGIDGSANHNARVAVATRFVEYIRLQQPRSADLE